MAVDIKGFADMQTALNALENGVQRDARGAVRDGAKVFADALKGDTPVWHDETDQPVHLADDIQVGGVSDKSGKVEAEVGYGKQTGYYAHFPNSGTSMQNPQHFIERTQATARDKVLAAMLTHLKRLGD